MIAASNRVLRQLLSFKNTFFAIYNVRIGHHRDTSGKSDDDETTEAEQRIPAESIERVASLPSDGDMTPSEHGCKSKKRVKRVVDSDSDRFVQSIISFVLFVVYVSVFTFSNH